MKISRLLLASLFFSLLFSIGFAPAAFADETASRSAAQRPNVVFILIDDMGWRDLSATGSEFYESPNIDRIAEQGTRFTRAYASCPVCSPSRAALLTGKYPARLHITNWIDPTGKQHPNKGKLIDAPYKTELPLDETTLAEALRDEGYATWHVGKWHLGGPNFYPTDQGFDVNVGGCEMGHPWNGYFSPYKIPTLPDGPDGEFLTNRLTDEAISLIRNHFQQENPTPFYLNLWHYAVHTPIQAPQDEIDRFRAKKRELGLFDLTEDELFGFEEGSVRFLPRVGERIRYRKVQEHAIYAAMIANLDANVGRLLDALRETGQLENTIVVFTSDNGGYSTYGGPTSNEPLRAGKSWLYEGGVREPLFIMQPGRIPAGALCDRPITTTDFYPTILDLVGAPQRPEQTLDGVSFADALLKNETKTTEETDANSPNVDVASRPIFWYYPHYSNSGTKGPEASVLRYPWKLILDLEDDSVELFNLDADPRERSNLAESEPERAAALRDELKNWAKKVDALEPALNPDWK